MPFETGANSLHMGWAEILVGLLTTILGVLGTLTVGLLVHLREAKKINSDSMLTEANTADRHWERFGREIKRLDERLEHVEAELVKCHEDKAKTELELAQLRLSMIERGNSRQTAQLVISELRAEAGGNYVRAESPKEPFEPDTE